MTFDVVKEYNRTNYEQQHDFRARQDLMDNCIINQIRKLSEQDFHLIYDLIWSLTAKDTILDATKLQLKRKGERK